MSLTTLRITTNRRNRAIAKSAIPTITPKSFCELTKSAAVSISHIENINTTKQVIFK